MNRIRLPVLLCASVMAGLLTGAPAWAQAEKNADPTPRRFMGPDSASKVRVYEAKRRRNFGVDPDGVVRQSTVATSAGQTKACNTTVGPTANAGSTSGSGWRGTGQNNSTVIITGDVINVCK